MAVRKSKAYLFIDSLMVLLNASNSYSILPFLLFFTTKHGMNTGLILILNVIYLCVRFKGKITIRLRGLFLIYFLLNFYNIFASYFSGTGSYHVWLGLLANCSFYILLSTIYCDYSKKLKSTQALWLTLRGYVWLAVYSVIVSILLFVLIKLGLNPYVNNISARMDIFADNVEKFFSTYYFPYGISVILADDQEILKLPFFFEKGIICGLYYEPHIITFMVFPVLFLLCARYNSFKMRLGLYTSWCLIMLMTASTTNILAFVVCVMVLLLTEKRLRVFLIPIIYGILVLVLTIGIENTELFFIQEKIESGSMGYSQRTIEFAFTPKTLIGSNFLSNSYLYSLSESNMRDVGYISFFLNIVFLILFIIKIGKFIISSKYSKYVGLAILYFFLHSMKVAMVTYSLSVLMIMIFVLSINPKLLNGDNETVTT